MKKKKTHPFGHCLKKKSIFTAVKITKKLFVSLQSTQARHFRSYMRKVIDSYNFFAPVVAFACFVYHSKQTETTYTVKL